MTTKTNAYQIGLSATANQNLTWYQPATPDGTVRLGVGNAGATTSDAITVDNSGNVTVAGTLNSAGGQPVWHGVQGTAQTLSGTATGFTGIPSWVKRITVILDNVYNTSGATSSLLVQIGSGSYQTSGYVCSAAGVGTSSAGSDPISTTGFSIIYGFNNNYKISGTMTLTYLGASNTWVCNYTFGGVGTTSVTGIGGGRVSLSGTLDRVQVLNTSGTFASGSVNIIYEG